MVNVLLTKLLTKIFIKYQVTFKILQWAAELCWFRHVSKLAIISVSFLCAWMIGSPEIVAVIFEYMKLRAWNKKAHCKIDKMLDYCQWWKHILRILNLQELSKRRKFPDVFSQNLMNIIYITRNNIEGNSK